MFKVVFSLALAVATIAPAQAATIYTSGSATLPGYINPQSIVYTNNFNVGAGEGATYSPVTPPETTSGTVRTYLNGVSGAAVSPGLGTGRFLAIGLTGGASDTFSIAFPAGVQVLSFVFGQLDNYNTVILNFANPTLNPQQILTGGQIIGRAGVNNVFTNPALTAGGVREAGRVTYDFGGLQSLTGITFRSNQAAFEIDSVVAAVPEPATWLMMILGFGLVGSQLRRRKGKLTLAAA